MYSHQDREKFALRLVLISTIAIIIMAIQATL